MECFDKDGNFFIPKRIPVTEAYILRRMETMNMTRKQVVTEMAKQDTIDSAPF
jgi:hypothetical protein